MDFDCPLDGFDVQTAAAALFAARVVDQTRDLFDGLDAQHDELGVRTIGGRNFNASYAHDAFHQSLLERHVIDIN
jgi:hypothetical protein